MDNKTRQPQSLAARPFPLVPLLPLVLIALAAAVYGNGLSGPFVFDDVNTIQHNPRAQQFGTLKSYLSTSERPLLFYTLALNYQLGGLRPVGYKLFNVAVHIVAALALMGLVRRTLLLPRFGEAFRETAAGLGFAVAALWVVHPLTTEAVTYIVHRGESMMGMFALLMFYCTVRGARSEAGFPWYVAAVMAGCLGFGCKQWMVAVPLVLLLYDRIMIGGEWEEWALRRGALYVALLIPLFWLLMINMGDIRTRIWGGAKNSATGPAGNLLASAASTVPPPSTPTTALSTPATVSVFASVPASNAANEFDMGTPRRYSSLEYLATQPEVISHYLRLAVWPYPLCVDYFWRRADTWERIVPAGLFIVSLLALTGWALWRHPPWGFLGAAFFLLLAPSSSIAAIEDMAADRRMYLPLVPLVTLMVMGAWTALGRLMAADPAGTDPTGDAAVEAEGEERRRFAGAILLVVVACVWGSLTILRNFDYANDIDLFERVAQQVPHNSRARVNLARALILAADQEAQLAAREVYYEEALKYLAEAEVVSPRGPYVHSQIGHIRSQQAEIERQLKRPGWQTRRNRQLAEAERRFRNATVLSPTNALFRLNLAVILEQQATPAAQKQALEEFKKAAEDGKNTEFRIAETHYGLARMLRKHDRLADAVPEYREALELNPWLVKARMDLAETLFKLGRKAEAVEAGSEAVSRAQRLKDAEAEADAQKLLQGFRKPAAQGTNGR